MHLPRAEVFAATVCTSTRGPAQVALARHAAMGVMHIVLLRIKPNTPPATVARLLAEVRGMESTIPELVRRATAGENFTNRSKGFTHGFTIELDSREVRAYAAPPAR